MPFFTNYSKRGTHVATPKGRSFRANFKCAWEGGGLELLAPIAFKNGQESIKNLEVMVKATMAQLPK
jgi:hypothetical protein